MVQNLATHIISRTPSTSHITPVMQHLYWVPIKFCTVFPTISCSSPSKFSTASPISIYGKITMPHYHTYLHSQVLLLHPTRPTTCSSDHYGLKSIQSFSTPPLKHSPLGHQKFFHNVHFQTLNQNSLLQTDIFSLTIFSHYLYLLCMMPILLFFIFIVRCP